MIRKVKKHLYRLVPVLSARFSKSQPGKRILFIPALLCIIILGVFIFSAEPRAKSKDDSILGCYEFDECLYMTPISSFFPVKGHMPVYGVGEKELIIANKETGIIERLTAQYEKTAIPGDEFTSRNTINLFNPPDVSQYKERWLRAVFTGGGQQWNLYQLDGQIWLAKLGNGNVGLWSIYRLQKTDEITLADLEHALDVQKEADEGKIQMTLSDVYKLSRKGKDLTLKDFDAYYGRAAGSGFSIIRYAIEGGCVLIVHADTPHSAINFARLSKRGYDPFEESVTVDIRDGAQAVAAYLNPLHTPEKLKIEDSRDGTGERELIYEFNGYRYYLNTKRADKVFITFENGDRMPLKQALEERRTIVEDLVANGLSNVTMEPVVNPLGGHFTILHHRHEFLFDGEVFYPSPSFMYTTVVDDYLSAYFDIAELAEILELQGRDEPAERLRLIESVGKPIFIAGKPYLSESGLKEAGIAVEIGWHLSSHTPVVFTTEEK